MDKHLELAKKLAALAEQGIGGEALNARTMLDRLMARHGISEDQLNSDQTARHWFRMERRYVDLFNQLTARAISYDAPVWKRKGYEGNRKTVERGVDCTAAQFIELDALMSILFPAWDEEVALLHKAFTARHNLYDQNREGREWDDLTEDEKADARRAKKMAESLKRREIQKRLEA